MGIIQTKGSSSVGVSVERLQILEDSYHKIHKEMAKKMEKSKSK